MNMSTKPTKKRNRPGQGRPYVPRGYSLITKRDITIKRRRSIEVYLTRGRAGLIADLGPTEADLTTAQVILIDRAISTLAIIRCIEEEARETGAFLDGELKPSLGKNYVAYQNAFRRTLEVLGINVKMGSRGASLADILGEVESDDK